MSPSLPAWRRRTPRRAPLRRPRPRHRATTRSSATARRRVTRTTGPARRPQQRPAQPGQGVRLGRLERVRHAAIAHAGPGREGHRHRAAGRPGSGRPAVPRPEPGPVRHRRRIRGQDGQAHGQADRHRQRSSLLRQRFGDLPAGHDGLVSVLVQQGQRGPRDLVAVAQHQRPAAGHDRRDDAAYAAALKPTPGSPPTRRSRRRSPRSPCPMPNGPARGPRTRCRHRTDPANPTAFATYVDARDRRRARTRGPGRLRLRQPDVGGVPGHSAAVLPAAGTDPRVVWCFAPRPGCAKTVQRPGQRPGLGRRPGHRHSRRSPRRATRPTTWCSGAPAPRPTPATPSPDRNYKYPFTDQWHQARCNPAGFTSAQRNDADAAVTNLFAMHNRMHDFAYHLGFTRRPGTCRSSTSSRAGPGRRPEKGRAQSGALSGSRNNANQGTAARRRCRRPRNMFLWQPRGRRPPTRRASTATTT